MEERDNASRAGEMGMEETMRALDSGRGCVKGDWGGAGVKGVGRCHARAEATANSMMLRFTPLRAATMSMASGTEPALCWRGQNSKVGRGGTDAVTLRARAGMRDL